MLAYTSIYVHLNIQRQRGRADTMNPSGFYVVLWGDGSVEKVPYHKLLYLPKGGGTGGHAFVGQTVTPPSRSTCRRATVPMRPEMPSSCLAAPGVCGAETEALCRAIVADRPHPERGYRSCLGILRLGETHGAARLERATRRALLTGARSYRRRQAIWRHHREEAPLPSEPPLPAPSLSHANLRGASYCQDQQDCKPC